MRQDQGIVIELIGGPSDGLVRLYREDPGAHIVAPGRYGFSHDSHYFWSGRITDEGRRAYLVAKFHSLQFPPR